MSARQAEQAVCRYQLAYLGAEPVSMLGHYTGRDQMVFLLGHSGSVSTPRDRSEPARPVV